jgi:hypothetical protein
VYVEEVLRMRVSSRGVVNGDKLKRCCEWGLVEEVLRTRVRLSAILETVTERVK